MTPLPKKQMCLRAHITNSIICGEVEVGEGADITSCIIVNRQKVLPNCKFSFSTAIFALLDSLAPNGGRNFIERKEGKVSFSAFIM